MGFGNDQIEQFLKGYSLVEHREESVCVWLCSFARRQQSFESFIKKPIVRFVQTCVKVFHTFARQSSARHG